MFTKPELKKCPFCGSDEIALEYYECQSDESPYWQICCDKCGAMTTKAHVEYPTIDVAFEAYFSAVEYVVNSWNKRSNV